MSGQELAPLHRALERAMALEHYALPPYLCALWSLHGPRNAEVIALMRSVVMEEMLHLALVANLSNAVGLRPSLTAPCFVADYPESAPGAAPELSLRLRRFCRPGIAAFAAWEAEAPADTPPALEGYRAVSSFYQALHLAIDEAGQVLGERRVFVGDPALQLEGPLYYGGRGRLLPVYDRGGALQVIERLLDQGGGRDRLASDGEAEATGATDSESHAHRFLALLSARRFRPSDAAEGSPTGRPIEVDWEGVWPMVDDPHTQLMATPPAVRRAQRDFAQGYASLLTLLERCFRGEPGVMEEAIRVMFSLQGEALRLMRLPISREGNAGPVFRVPTGDSYLPKSLFS